MSKKQQKVDIINIMSTNDMPYISVCDFDYVKDKLISCRKAAEIPKNAKSIILAIFPYKVNTAPPKRISRYAAVPDYHKVCEKMLRSATQQLSERFPKMSFAFL